MPEGLTIIFDLDGTLSNPQEGIIRSINFALEKLGKDPRPEKALTRFIGPPLKEIFSYLLDTYDDDFLMKAIGLFRQRYFSVGYRENRLYNGILDLLIQLNNEGSHLYIATTKREDIASKVAEYLGIKGYFKGIFGCDLDTPKAKVLRNILSIEGKRKTSAFMVGDRKTDMEAASAVRVRTVGVNWGFGSPSELSFAEVAVDSPLELSRFFRSENERD